MILLKGKLVKQNGLYFAQFKNKRSKCVTAYILNQKECKNLAGNKYYFQFLTMIRPQSSGYDNLHVIKYETIFNLIGTNGQTDDLEELLKYDYLPSLVKIKLTKI